METIEMKRDVRYVAAMMADVPMFIARALATNKALIGTNNNGNIFEELALTDNISSALKAPDKTTIRGLISVYKRDHKIDEDFTILPIEITYRIIDYGN